jgi:hypothetical protein
MNKKAPWLRFNKPTRASYEAWIRSIADLSKQEMEKVPTHPYTIEMLGFDPKTDPEFQAWQKKEMVERTPKRTKQIVAYANWLLSDQRTPKSPWKKAVKKGT